MKFKINEENRIYEYTKDPLCDDHDVEVQEWMLPDLTKGKTLFDYSYVNGEFVYIVPSEEELPIEE